MGLKKVLVAGATGNVGYAAAKYFSHLPEWDVVGVSRRTPQGLHDVELLSVDLTDRERCAEVFSQMHDVTHLIYAALYEKPGLIPGWLEQDQMETNLAMLRNLFEPLEEAATQLKHVTFMQGTKAYGVHVAPMEVPGKERNPRHQHENFYWMQEDYIREKQENGRGWSWTIPRPQIVFGEALGSNMNPIPALLGSTPLYNATPGYRSTSLERHRSSPRQRTRTSWPGRCTGQQRRLVHITSTSTSPTATCS